MNITVEAKKPKGKGLTVVRMEYISMDKIIGQKGNNKARAKGIITEKVTKFEQMILSGQYEPHYHAPPVVTDNGDGTYKLITGEHRYQAHMGRNRDKIWVAVCTFSSKTLENRYQSLENKKGLDYIPPERTLEDIVSSLTNALQEEIGNDKLTEKLVDKFITDWDISSEEGDKKEIRRQVLKDFGIKEAVQTFTKAAVKVYIDTVHKDDSLPFDCLMKNVNGKERDLDHRYIFQLIRWGIKHPSILRSVYMHWQRMDSLNLKNVKSKKIKHWKNVLNEICLMAEWIESQGGADDVVKNWNIQYLPQLEDDR